MRNMFLQSEEFSNQIQEKRTNIEDEHPQIKLLWL